MAPKSNDTLIWIVLGIGGLYLLSQKDEDSKQTIEVHLPTPDYGRGKVGGGEEPEKMDLDKKGWTDDGGLDKKPERPRISRWDKAYYHVLQEIQKLDGEVGEVFRLYNSTGSSCNGTHYDPLFPSTRHSAPAAASGGAPEDCATRRTELEELGKQLKLVQTPSPEDVKRAQGPLEEVFPELTRPRWPITSSCWCSFSSGHIRSRQQLCATTRQRHVSGRA